MAQCCNREEARKQAAKRNNSGTNTAWTNAEGFLLQEASSIGNFILIE